MNSKKKIYVLENNTAMIGLKSFFTRYLDENKASVETHEIAMQSLPQGYDIYLIHSSLVTPSTLENLVQEMPNSSIFIRDTIIWTKLSAKNLKHYGDSDSGNNILFDLHPALKEKGVLNNEIF